MKEEIEARIEENESILKMAELHMDERAVIVLKQRIFELEKQVDVSVSIVEEHPLERLRNKLTPYLNLVALLKNNHSGKLVQKELNNCIQNAPDIHKHLSECETFYLSQSKPIEAVELKNTGLEGNLYKVANPDSESGTWYKDQAGYDFYLQKVEAVKEDEDEMPDAENIKIYGRPISTFLLPDQVRFINDYFKPFIQRKNTKQ